MSTRTATPGLRLPTRAIKLPVDAGFESQPCTYPGGFGHSAEPAHLFLPALRYPAPPAPTFVLTSQPHTPPAAAEDEHAK